MLTIDVSFKSLQEEVNRRLTIKKAFERQICLEYGIDHDRLYDCPMSVIDFVFREASLMMESVPIGKLETI